MLIDINLVLLFDIHIHLHHSSATQAHFDFILIQAFCIIYRSSISRSSNNSIAVVVSVVEEVVVVAAAILV